MSSFDSKDCKLDEIDQKKELKILLIGDCNVGKTCLSLKYFNSNRNNRHDKLNDNNEHDVNNNCIHTDLESSSINQYNPTTLSVYKCHIKINSTDYSLSLTDTSGCRQNEKFVQLRKHYYSITKDIDVIIMCFSLVDQRSYANISKKWYPEIRSSYTDVPILLVGTKLDVKHQIKYQKKFHLATKMSHLSTDDLPISMPELNKHSQIDNTLELNDQDETNRNISLSIDNTTALVNNKLAAKTENSKNVKKRCFKKCNYCANLEQKSRCSKASFLSTLTSRAQIDTRAKAVSIISEVSQQHTILIPPLNQFEQKTKSLVNIHESNKNLINILKEDNIDLLTDNDEIKYNIEEYGVDDNLEDPFDADYFKNLNLNEENCACNDYKTVHEFNSYDYDLDQLGQIEMINNQLNQFNNLRDENLFETNLEKSVNSIKRLTDSGKRVSNVSVKTVLIDNEDPLTEEATLTKRDSECDNLLKTSTQSLIKRKACYKLKESMNAKKYLECSCLDETSVKVVMDSAIELALEYHLNKTKLIKQTSNSSKSTTQTNKNNYIFKYSGLIGSLMKDSSNNSNVSNNSTNTKEFSLFSLKKNKSIPNDKVVRDYKSCDEIDDTTDNPISSYVTKRDSIKSNQILSNNLDARSEKTDSDCFKSKHKQKNKQNKPDRQLSLRCLSCTRGINDTSTSLNKV